MHDEDKPWLVTLLMIWLGVDAIQKEANLKKTDVSAKGKLEEVDLLVEGAESKGVEGSHVKDTKASSQNRGGQRKNGKPWESFSGTLGGWGCWKKETIGRAVLAVQIRLYLLTKNNKGFLHQKRVEQV